MQTKCSNHSLPSPKHPSNTPLALWRNTQNSKPRLRKSLPSLNTLQHPEKVSHIPITTKLNQTKPNTISPINPNNLNPPPPTPLSLLLQLPSRKTTPSTGARGGGLSDDNMRHRLARHGY